MNTRSLPRMRGQSLQDIDARRRATRSQGTTSVPSAAAELHRQVWQPVWLADMLTPDKNSFGVLRLAMALAVLVSHAVFLTTNDTKLEPIYRWTGYTLGQHGVQVFFILSGILVAQSLFQSRSVKDYAIARGLRIFPALAVCVLLTAMVLGPLFSELSAAVYMQGKWTAAYILRTLSLSTGDATLPGLFVDNLAANKVNTSVWTLKYEVACYGLLALIGMLVMRVQAWRQAAMIIGGVWLILAVAVPTGISASQGDRSALQVLHYFTIFFGTGVLAYALRAYVPVHGLLLVPLAALMWLATGTRFAVPAMALTLGYASIWLATFRFGSLRAFTNANDYSYSTYLYHFPVAQAVLHVVPDMHVVPLVGMTGGIALLLALLSWEMIERPALAMRKRFQRDSATADVVPAAVSADSAIASERVSADQPLARVVRSTPKPAGSVQAQTSSMSPPVSTPAQSTAPAPSPDALPSEPAPLDPPEPADALAATKPKVAATSTAEPQPGSAATSDAARVWRPMPTRRTITVMPDAPVISGAAEPVVAAPAAKLDTPAQASLPRAMAPRLPGPTAAPRRAPEPPAPNSVISRSRMALATKRPKPQMPLAVEAPMDTEGESGRAVVAVGSDTPLSRRPAPPRPNWQKPLETQVPV